MSSDVCVARDDQTEECVVVLHDGPFICAVFSRDGDTLRSSRLDCAALAAAAPLPAVRFCAWMPWLPPAGERGYCSACLGMLSEAPTEVRLS